MYDTINITNLEIYCNHGVFVEENKLGQKFLVSANLYTDFSIATENDDLTKSINYGTVCKKITDFMKNNTFKLIETVAEKIAEMLLTEYYTFLKGVKIEIKKPWAPIGLPIDTVSVTLERFWHTAYIALGSNMGDKHSYITNAIDTLNNTFGCRVEKVSDLIITKPYGDVEQDDFLNGVLCLKTIFSPEKLLNILNKIESEAKRERVVHWGPRTLDLDIIFYDNQIIDTERLHIPHIDMQNRKFVLEPMTQIAGFYRHPVLNKTIEQLLKEVE